MILPLIARRHPKGRVPLMAFKTSVKAVLLSLEPEPQAEPPHFFPREREPLPERPRLPEPSAPPPPRPTDAEPGNWSGRAEKIRAMVPLLPSEATRPLMLKIAELYAELANDAPARAAPAPESPPPDALAPEDLPPEEPSAVAPPRDLGVASRIAFPRRPLPLRHSGSARR